MPQCGFQKIHFLSIANKNPMQRLLQIGWSLHAFGSNARQAKVGRRYTSWTFCRSFLRLTSRAVLAETTCSVPKSVLFGLASRQSSCPVRQCRRITLSPLATGKPMSMSLFTGSTDITWDTKILYFAVVVATTWILASKGLHFPTVLEGVYKSNDKTSITLKGVT